MSRKFHIEFHRSLFIITIPNEDFPGARSIRRTDKAFLFHGLYHSCRPVITDPQSSLQHGNRGMAGFTYYTYSLVISIIGLHLIDCGTGRVVPDPPPVVGQPPVPASLANPQAKP